MKAAYFYCVGGFVFSVVTDRAVDIDRLLPSFVPFRCDGAEESPRLLFRLAVHPVSSVAGEAAGRLLDEMANDMGHTCLYAADGGYRMDIRYGSRGKIHRLYAASGFTQAEALLCRDDACAGEVLCSMLRMVYSQAVLGRDAVSVHASVVCAGRRAYLFMGKSGTGKSTHASLWLKHIPGSWLLNDDNPIVRIEEGAAYAYGSPWSGKTPCYKNRRLPVGGMVRLCQAPANRFVAQSDVDAFITLLPGCSAIRQDARLYDALCATLASLAGCVPVGVLHCRPDKEAAILCFNSMNKMIGIE